MSFLPGILTVIIDSEAQVYFNELRKRYFPPERNYLDAHLTLFHNLPLDEPAITDVIKQVCYNTNMFSPSVSSIKSIGNGVAFKIESAELQAIHKRLQKDWEKWLIPQDKQKIWPHITIQNKTNASIANKLIAELQPDFMPFEIRAMGFNLWEYKGGPWEFIGAYYFQN